MVRAASETSPTFYVACVTWLLCVIFLVRSGLGILGFFGSILFLIFMFGLREKFSNEETASAYSVFNQNQQSISGSLTGDQVDRQLRGGFSSFPNRTSSSSSIPTADAAPQSQSSFVQSVDKGERLRRRANAALAAEQRLHSEIDRS
jgi:hypothetical protein